MKTKALIGAVIASALLLGTPAHAFQASEGGGGGSIGTGGVSEGGGWRFTPSKPRHWRREGPGGEKVPGGIHGGTYIDSGGNSRCCKDSDGNKSRPDK